MNIRRATQHYETWLGEHLTLIPNDLATKHTNMADTLFPFFRRDLLSLGSGVATRLRRSGQGASGTG